jgi:hypothetical protein
MKLIDVCFSCSVCRLRSPLLLYVGSPPPSRFFCPYLRAVYLRMLLSPLQLLFSSMSKLAEIFKLVMIFTLRLSLSAFTFVPCFV